MKALTLIVIVIISQTAFGQQLIGASGASSISIAGQISWSAGEAIIALPGGAGETLAVGFHQPTLSVTTVVAPGVFYSLQVYPNPTKSTLMLETKEDISGVFDVTIHDATGKEVGRFYFEPNVTNRLQIDAQGWMSGVHIVTIVGKRKKVVAQYKVVKL